jgi:hypothetical protein
VLRVAAEDKETETPKGSLFALGEFVHKTGHLVQKCYTKLEHWHEIALTLYRRIVKLEAELRDMAKEIDSEMLAKCKLQRLVDNLQERESAHGRAIAEMRICVLAAQRICDEDVYDHHGDRINAPAQLNDPVGRARKRQRTHDVATVRVRCSVP